jgi:L-threonylcarbamoyladenylate synthase
MAMARIRIDAAAPDPGAIERAAAVIRSGGLVAFPTETVYGLGANAMDPAAVQRVFEAKGRPRHNPLIAHVAHEEGARRLVSTWPAAASRLAAAFWPGPLTLVLPRGDAVPAAVSAGLPDLAVRVPAHPVALALLRAADLPIVAPSANPSTALSPTSADHVAKYLDLQVDLILDAGPTHLGIESTVIDLSQHPPILLRPGSLSADRIEAIIGPLASPVAGTGALRHASPGMLERHYAPRATLVVFEPQDPARAAERARDAERAGRTVGALLLGGLDAPVHHPVAMPHDPHAYARDLFAQLHRLDDLGCDLILAEQVPGDTAWDGVRDRLKRAAHPVREPG